MTVILSEEEALSLVEKQFVKANNEVARHVKQAVADSWSRLLAPSMETEFRKTSKEKADEEAIHVFAENLRQLLLAAPL